MKDRLISAYMETAKIFAKLSYSKRLQVGAIIVKDDRIISIGYNGQPSGWDNNCEDVVGIDKDGNEILKTKSTVLHAELNAISKLAKSTESGKDSILLTTHSPCLDCAKVIYQAGITEIYYGEDYRSNDGIDFLKKCGIKIQKHNKE